MPRATSDSEMLSVRIPREWFGEADEIAKLISQPGATMTRSDAFRVAIARGFAQIRAEAKRKRTTKK